AVERNSKQEKNVKQFTAIVLLAAIAAVPQLSWGNPTDDKVQKIRFVEDDGQNYMTSKIYTLQHQKANDVVPFVLGAVKRYAKNSTVDRTTLNSLLSSLVFNHTSVLQTNSPRQKARSQVQP
ncbi:MAG: hypothetical protein IKA04_09775, partial [Alistipes sp.]|nr:hypothetical protein [Alistipes sp.]